MVISRRYGKNEGYCSEKRADQGISQEAPEGVSKGNREDVEAFSRLGAEDSKGGIVMERACWSCGKAMTDAPEYGAGWMKCSCGATWNPPTDYGEAFVSSETDHYLVGERAGSPTKVKGPGRGFTASPKKPRRNDPNQSKF